MAMTATISTRVKPPFPFNGRLEPAPAPPAMSSTLMLTACVSLGLILHKPAKIPVQHFLAKKQCQQPPYGDKGREGKGVLPFF